MDTRWPVISSEYFDWFFRVPLVLFRQELSELHLDEIPFPIVRAARATQESAVSSEYTRWNTQIESAYFAPKGNRIPDSIHAGLFPVDSLSALVSSSTWMPVLREIALIKMRRGGVVRPSLSTIRDISSGATLNIRVIAY
jgi:hypothetical protein